mmetsp:Transcript_28085/g.42480  ORF Transcript_28085/g.42480 Transcript_28085/m.42480 type:complete len:227 (-) Transcript_28085:143-823(-)
MALTRMVAFIENNEVEVLHLEEAMDHNVIQLLHGEDHDVGVIQLDRPVIGLVLAAVLPQGLLELVLHFQVSVLLDEAALLVNKILGGHQHEHLLVRHLGIPLLPEVVFRVQLDHLVARGVLLEYIQDHHDGDQGLASAGGHEHDGTTNFWLLLPLLDDVIENFGLMRHRLEAGSYERQREGPRLLFLEVERFRYHPGRSEFVLGLFWIGLLPILRERLILADQIDL